jgi:hypothetical protein
MNRLIVQALAIFAVGVAPASAALAATDYWGTIEGAHICDKELAAAGDKVYDWIKEARKTGKGLSPQCKAEMDKRMPGCLKDKWMQRELTDPELNHGDPNGLCFERIFATISEQIGEEKVRKEDAERQAKLQEEENAKRAADIAAVELPKADKHDAKLEKAVADAYHRDYPEGKVLFVILGNWSDDYEKDAFNRVTGRDLDATVVNKQPDGKCQIHNEYWMQHGNGRSFSGPLSARGAGSMNKKEILCSKVEGAGAAAPSAKKTKKN